MQEFDRILEVNGVRGNSVELAKALGILAWHEVKTWLPLRVGAKFAPAKREKVSKHAKPIGGERTYHNSQPISLET